jgi:ADP-heptose:LPS heptosyltransferase
VSPAYHTSILVTAGEADGWKECLAAMPEPCVVVGHNLTLDVYHLLPNVEDTLSWEGPFSWGPLVSLAAQQARGPWLLICHDDVRPPDRDAVEHMQAVAQLAQSWIVVPSMGGDCPSARQAAEGLPGWSHCTEYLSDACMLVHKGLLSMLGGLPAIPGRGFYAGWLQHRYLREKRRLAVIDHEVRVEHAGSGTFGQRHPAQGLRQMAADATHWAAGDLHIHLDSRTRIGEPRVVRHDPGVAEVRETPEYLSINGFRFAVTGEETEAQLLAESLNCAMSDDVLFRGKKYRRFALGTEYAVPEQGHTIGFAAYSGMGLGDHFFAMRGFRALKEAFPAMKVRWCCDRWIAGPMSRCLDIDDVEVVNWSGCQPDYIDMNRVTSFTGNSAEKFCAYFGIEYKGQPARYEVRSEEMEEAQAALVDGGWQPGGPPLIGVQGKGGWLQKRWWHSATFARQARQRGYQVWMMDQEIPRFRLPGMVSLRRGAPETFIAALSLLDVLVGFDSGPVHAASALGVPVIALYGPQEPGKYLFEGAVHNAVAIRSRDPWRDCGEANCMAAHGGVMCPLRGDAPGGDCMDEVTPTEVWRYVDEVARSRQAR